MKFSNWNRAIAAGAVLALGVACGGGGAEAAADEQVSLMNKMSNVLEGITDLDSLEDAKPKMRELGAQLAERAKQWEAKAKQWASDPSMAAAAMEYGKEMAAAGARMSTAFMQLAMKPGLAEHMSELSEAMGEAMQESGR